MIPVINGIKEPVKRQKVNAGLPTVATTEDFEDLTGKRSVRNKEGVRDQIGRLHWVNVFVAKECWDTHVGEWPLIYDNSFRLLKNDAESSFLQSQIDKEVKVEHYSQPFGTDLLPGMYSMPIHAVPKPGTDKHRLVTDHSAGKYALNSMISIG
jgi:hypothetical protein